MNMTLTYISLNWVELAKLIKAKNPKTVYGYVTGLAAETGGYLYAGGKAVRYENRPSPWMYATYNCGREIKIRFEYFNGKYEEFTCETLEVPWELGEYWPKVALTILEN